MSALSYIVVALIMFLIGACGVLVRKNVVSIFMCIELMLNAVNLVLVTASNVHQNLEGQIAVLFVIMVAAVEAAVGLAIAIALFKHTKTSDVESATELRG